MLEVQDAESGEGFALVGPVAHLSAGDRAEVSGDWQTHSRYGRQLRARGALPLDPADREGQIAYLTSLRHIGPARAERLVDEHGEGVLGAIAADPAASSARCAGSATNQAAAAAESWHASRARPRPPRPARAPRARPPGGADPRPLRRALDGDPARGPLPADRGRRRRLRPRRQDRPRRRRAARVQPPRPGRRRLRPRRGRAAGQHLPAAGRADRAHREADRPRARPRRAGRRRRACWSRRGASTASRPTPASSRSRRRCAAAPPRRPTSTTIPASAAGGREQGSLTDEQWAAVRGAFAARVSVLTGGPGVGKTVCTRAIVAEAEAADATIALCAPTGRAARRLEEATGHEAQTIHRLLEWMPGREPAYKPGHPLPADLVIVDESSMLNLRLAEVLLGGLAETTHVVLVGDADQLPPIGAGKPFDDLIASGIAPVVRLTPDLPPGGALDDHHRRPRDQPGPAAAPASRPPDQDHDFFFIDRPGARAGAGDGGRGGRRAGAGALRRRPDPRGPGAGADVPRGGRDRRPQRAPAGSGSTRTASRR